MNFRLLVGKLLLKLLASRRRATFIEACKSPENFQKKLHQKLVKNSRRSFPETPTDYLYYKDKSDLTLEPVKFYEQTSGSTGNKKSIPYTKSMLRSFENMFLIWVHDLLFHSGINFKSGKFFMSVSPQIGASNTDDRKYLSPLVVWLLEPFLASNPNEHKAKTGHEFLHKVATDLIKSRDLEIISVWSPTYLLSLLEFIKTNKESLKVPTLNWIELWPELKLISCWTHGQAEKSASLIEEIFPGVKIQAKGLLLTEAPVTLPWSDAKENIPLVNETYLEFYKDQKIYQLHELRDNESYIVLTSQWNGFLRYNTQDEVRVNGFYFKTPMLQFLGRTGQYSDMAGEKLSETMLRELFKEIKSNFLFIPDQSSELPSYTVLCEENFDFEQKLKSIYHYNLARELQQLKELKMKIVPSVSNLYLKFSQSEGMVLGDIKEKVLIANLKQAQKFQAWLEKELHSSH